MRGLKAKLRTPDQEVVLWFEVAACYEQKKVPSRASGVLPKDARARSDHYRDVQERVRRLSKSASPKGPIRQAAVGADDEFDRAFDDLMSDGKPS